MIKRLRRKRDFCHLFSPYRAIRQPALNGCSILHLSARRSHAHADGYFDFSAIYKNVGRFNIREQSITGDLGTSQIRLWKHDGKFFTAQPADQINRSEFTDQHTGHSAQHPIARIVPIPLKKLLLPNGVDADSIH